MEETKEQKPIISENKNEPETIFLSSQELGIKANEFIKQKNYISAKTLLIQACEKLAKILKMSPNNIQIKQLFSQLLQQAEECQKILGNLYKINVFLIKCLVNE